MKLTNEQVTNLAQALYHRGNSQSADELSQLVNEIIDTYDGMREKARKAGKRRATEQMAWAAEATRVLILTKYLKTPYELGILAYEKGSPRIVPIDLAGPTAEKWYRGWDAAFLTASPEGHETASTTRPRRPNHDD